MTSPADILAAVGSVKVIEAGANLTVPKDVKDHAKVRDIVHGWAMVEIQTPNGRKEMKFSEHRNGKTIRRNILGAIDPALNLNHGRSAAIRAKLDNVVANVYKAAHDAAIQKVGQNGEKASARIADIVAKRKERQKKQEYIDACSKVHSILQGPLANMDEEELLEIFRHARVDQVMSS
jgi:hypothetical protein